MPFKSFLNTPPELKNFSGQVWWHTLLVLALGREWQVDRSLWVWNQLVLNRVPGQAELHSETLSQNRTKQPPPPNLTTATQLNPNPIMKILLYLARCQTPVALLLEPSPHAPIATVSHVLLGVYTTVLSVSPFPVLLCSDSSFPGLRAYISVS